MSGKEKAISGLAQQMRRQLSNYFEKMRSFQEIAEAESFVLISVEYAVLTDNGRAIPCEIAAAPATIKNGVDVDRIYNVYPKPVLPKGYGALAKQHSDSTHKILMNFHHYSSCYEKIAESLKSIVNSTEMNVFVCLSSELTTVVSALAVLLESAGFERKFLPEVITAEHLVEALYERAFGHENGDAVEWLHRSTFDYCKAMRCDYHSQNEVYHCSRAKIIRLCCNMMDTFEMNEELKSMLECLRHSGKGSPTQRRAVDAYSRLQTTGLSTSAVEVALPKALGKAKQSLIDDTNMDKLDFTKQRSDKRLTTTTIAGQKSGPRPSGMDRPALGAWRRSNDKRQQFNLQSSSRSEQPLQLQASKEDNETAASRFPLAKCVPVSPCAADEVISNEEMSSDGQQREQGNTTSVAGQLNLAEQQESRVFPFFN